MTTCAVRAGGQTKKQLSARSRDSTTTRNQNVSQPYSIMKLFVFVVVVVTVISSVAAFAPALISSRCRSSPQSMALAASATTTAIEAALAASKEHGPTSKEAMLAWETVEEMNASDNRCVSVCCGLTFIEILNSNSFIDGFLPDHIFSGGYYSVFNSQPFPIVFSTQHNK
jgi:hypothetical protein